MSCSRILNLLTVSVRKQANDNSLMPIPLATRLYPTEAYKFNFFASVLLLYMFPALLMISYAFPFMHSVGEIVSEKEHRLKEGMKIMVTFVFLAACSRCLKNKNGMATLLENANRADFSVMFCWCVDRLY